LPDVVDALNLIVDTGSRCEVRQLSTPEEPVIVSLIVADICHNDSLDASPQGNVEVCNDNRPSGIYSTNFEGVVEAGVAVRPGHLGKEFVYSNQRVHIHALLVVGPVCFVEVVVHGEGVVREKERLEIGGSRKSGGKRWLEEYCAREISSRKRELRRECFGL
jgi:hypothetical protein